MPLISLNFKWLNRGYGLENFASWVKENKKENKGNRQKTLTNVVNTLLDRFKSGNIEIEEWLRKNKDR